MTFTIDELLQIDTKIFGNMKREELQEIFEQLKEEKKDRTKQFVKPVMDKEIKPLMDQHIKPVKEEYIKPIMKLMKQLKTYMPKMKPKPAFITINGKRYGPFNSKKELTEMITEVENDDEQ